MIRNDRIIEFVSGHIVEHFRKEENIISFQESSSVKWGAIGVVSNTHDRVPETTFIRYRIKIILNQGKPIEIIIGANEENIKELTPACAKQYESLLGDA